LGVYRIVVSDFLNAGSGLKIYKIIGERAPGLR
jgi:hypothetical protein